ncbi:MAG: N-acetylglucosamine-6-phosphate deacetylase, partial [Lentisphaerota bacterium]
TTVSLGHQLANSADFAKAAAAGAKAMTHLGNGLPNLLPRHPNTLWDGIAEDSLVAMIITDGHHLPPSVIKTIIRAKGVDNCVVVSDAAPIAGLKPGKYRNLGGEVVLDKSGRLYNPVLNCLSGSSFNMTKCMNYLKGLNLLSEKELIKIGYENPLKLIGA